MILYISDGEVERLATMADAIDCLEAAFRSWKSDGTATQPRTTLPLPGRRMLRTMAASLPALDAFGYKASFNMGGGGSQLVMLYSLSENRLIAMIEAGLLGLIRTGAASGVATRHLARQNAVTVGLIGAGTHGRSQLMAMATVRPIARARVFSRNKETRERFARDVGRELGIEIVAANSARAAVEGADILITATRGTESVLLGDWLVPGVHINAMGANAAGRRELDDAAVLKCDRVAVDDLAQSKLEAGELIGLVAAGRRRWDDFVELGDIVRGAQPGRKAAGEITLFNSLGIAFEDVAFARWIYDRAVERGLGKRLELP